VPDALFVTDDHLVEPVADALVEFGVRVPDDMLVVGHWNFPLRFRRELPVQLIGFDCVALLARWIESIDAQRRGDEVPQETVVDLVFKGERPLMTPAQVQQLPAPV
jgi:DNA-binding LacI/PurR family transcriptional regulator